MTAGRDELTETLQAARFRFWESNWVTRQAPAAESRNVKREAVPLSAWIPALGNLITWPKNAGKLSEATETHTAEAKLLFSGNKA